MIFNQKVLFTKEEVHLILPYMNDLKSATLKKMINYNGVLYKNGEFLRKRLDFTDENIWIFEKIKKWTNELNMGLIWNSSPFTAFRKYKEGDFFIKHTDEFESNYNKNRNELKILTISIQLSDEDEYEGGDFLVWDNNKEIIVDKKIGNAIMFSTNVLHEVKEIKKGVRTSLVLFVSDKNVKFNNSLI